jgi:GTP-binding protein EngB required for normal cell division
VSTLGERIAALGEAATAAEGRVDADITTAAAEVVRRAGERVAFSGDHTVVALAGATGSGKSSLFNAITGTQLAEATVRRPTTSRAMGVAWGSEMPHDLLDWLDIPRRHLIASGPGEFSSLVLLDLPDHDSTEASHQLAVDRLVRVVDSLIWVVDPEKYADAALHERYLAPLAPYAEVMMVVLNQSDRLSPEDLDCCVTDLRRLLDAEGLRATPLMTASALRGVGVPELRELLARTAATKRASVRRIAADVAVVGRRLSDALGPRRTPRLNQRATDTLVDSLGEAAGVPVVVDAARKAWVKRGTAATTWPLVGWLGRLRADPLKRLGLERGEAARTSLPRPGAVARARLDRSLRVVPEAASAGLPQGWADALAAAARSRTPTLPDSLDAAVAGTDLRVEGGSWWWTAFRVLQWLLLLALVVGLGWLFANPLLGLAGLPPAPAVLWGSVPAQFWLLGGGLLGGVLLAVLGRAFVGLGANAKARSAGRSLRSAVAGVAETEVLEPVRDELERYRTAVDAVRTALR